jgi:DNA-directed RNA polymerase sigma subunit (sigma70/sigma32)
MSRTARENPSVRKNSKTSGEAATPRSASSGAKLAPSGKSFPSGTASIVPSRVPSRGGRSVSASASAVAEPPREPVAKRPSGKSRAARPAEAQSITDAPRSAAKTSRGRAATAVPTVDVAAKSAPAKPIRSAVVRSVTKASASDAAATRAAKAPAKPLTLAERPIDQVWREYRTTPTEEVRNFLVGRHLDLVAYAAERLHKRLPSEVEINDLKSAGAFGLMDAVESFDPDRGVKFETYCTQRIRGAMFDELRSMDWVPRLVRSRTAKVEKVRKSIEMETGARPTEDEVAARLNV